MSNQAFFDQFREMFNDPFQRRELVEYFDKLVQEVTQNPKPMRVAFIGSYDNFLGALGHDDTLIDEVNEATINEALTLVHCIGESDVYGKQFDAFVLYNRNNSQSLFDAAFYLAGHNVPKLTKDEFLKMLSDYRGESGVITFKIAHHA
jgi:hypothetical protein